jgi:hypothetical protein
LSTLSGCGGCQQAAAADAKSLEELYQMATKTPSDIHEHCAQLRELASGCDVVIEFGVRRSVSTTALLAGQPRRFVSYKLYEDPATSALQQRRGDTEFISRIGDSLAIEPEACDLLFIDTRHTAVQLAGELQRHAPHVRRWIALHDTQIYGERGEDGGPGLLPALRQFVKEHPEWSVVSHTQANHEFTVLGRDPRDKPKLPGMVTLATNFSKALAAHVADGLQKVSSGLLQTRLELCTLCPQRVDNRCSVCGCFLEEKAAWRSSECPLGKWPMEAPTPVPHSSTPAAANAPAELSVEAPAMESDPTVEEPPRLNASPGPVRVAIISPVCCTGGVERQILGMVKHAGPQIEWTGMAILDRGDSDDPTVIELSRWHQVRGTPRMRSVSNPASTRSIRSPSTPTW